MHHIPGRVNRNEPQSILIDAISHRPGDVVVILGTVDTGKSTLARLLIERHRVDGAILIDTDLGQGSIGPPGTIAAAWFGPQGDESRTVGAVFIGAINPVGHSHDMASACARIVAAARAMKPGIIIIDTCGLIQGRIGLALKRSLVSAISPNIVLGIERGHELEDILAPAAGIQPRQVLRLVPSPDVGRKTAAARRGARDRRLAHFMRAASTVVFQVAHQGTGRPLAGGASAGGSSTAVPAGLDLSRRLAGLLDPDGDCLGIGIVVDARDPDHITVQTSVRNLDGVAALTLGALRVDESRLRQGMTAVDGVALHLESAPNLALTVAVEPKTVIRSRMIY